MTALPVWDYFRSKGYLTAQAAAERLLGLTLGPTCRDATSFDSFLIPPPLLSFLRDAEVFSEPAFFDSHNPLKVVFAKPGTQQLIRRWCLPRTWFDFPVDAILFAEAYAEQEQAVGGVIQEVSCQSDVDQAFVAWASAVEGAVDSAIRVGHRRDPMRAPQSYLPRSYRGRCRQPRFVQRQGPQLPRAGRHGDYQPDVEVTSVRLRMRVRQCRRVRTFLSGLTKLEGLQHPPDSLVEQLFREWEAILRAKGYGESFASWALSWPCITMFPVDWPCAEWIADLVLLLEYARPSLSKRRRCAVTLAATVLMTMQGMVTRARPIVSCAVHLRPEKHVGGGTKCLGRICRNTPANARRQETAPGTQQLCGNQRAPTTIQGRQDCNGRP